ncbi:hypothetical protein RJ639_023288 [Escallonia herrerae]|uniref:Bifunctional inhibitor/plant lipid transfer protein/seed storage helical domain-containing protein n=1 Tax=Escallonia herrerae TaxID=1293975 RepID=A0AA88V1S6_9ASTE|nr:hypothetical protein RJ639_023288 [Escallonia herrerae]
MAKHRILYVTFALLLVAFIASSSRTSITTIEIDEENPTGQSLDACKRYLVQSSRPRTGWREEFQQCCEQLEEMDERSRCEGIRRIAQQEKQQQGGSRGEEMQEIMQTATGAVPRGTAALRDSGIALVLEGLIGDGANAIGEMCMRIKFSAVLL